MSKAKRNLTWRTAMALHRALKTGREYTASEIREELVKHGGDARYIGPAAKWLRDHGIAVAAQKRRQLSIWYEAQTPARMNEYGKQVVQESYSELVSNARSCKILTGRGSKVARDRLIRAAIGLGDYLGFTAEEVIEDCKPLHSVTVGAGRVKPNGSV